MKASSVALFIPLIIAFFSAIYWVISPRRSWNLRWLRQESAVHEALPDGDAKDALRKLIDLNTRRYVDNVLSWRSDGLDRWLINATAAMLAIGLSAAVVNTFVLNPPETNRDAIEQTASALLFVIVVSLALRSQRARLSPSKEQREAEEFLLEDIWETLPSIACCPNGRGTVAGGRKGRETAPRGSRETQGRGRE